MERVGRDLRNKAVISSLSELKKAIKGIKAGITRSWELMEKENEETKKEMMEARAVRDEILGEVNRFKNLLEDHERNIKEKEDEIAALASECNKLKEILEQEKEYRVNSELHTEEVIKEVYDSMFSIVTKYEGVDFVTSRINLRPSIDPSQDRV